MMLVATAWANPENPEPKSTAEETEESEGEEEEETTTYTVSFALAGNSDNLTGNWGGTWFGPLPVSANFCRYPGRQGSIVIQRI